MADRLLIKAGEKAVEAALNNSKASRMFLDNLPLTLNFETPGPQERYANLPGKVKMPRTGQHLTLKHGDLACYVPWSVLVVFLPDYYSAGAHILLGSLDEEVVQAVVQHDEISFYKP